MIQEQVSTREGTRGLGNGLGNRCVECGWRGEDRVSAVRKRKEGERVLQELVSMLI